MTTTHDGRIAEAAERLAENPYREGPQALLKDVLNAPESTDGQRQRAQETLDEATDARLQLEAAGTPGAPDDLWPGYSDDAPPPEGWVPPEPAPDADGIVTFSHV